MNYTINEIPDEAVELSGNEMIPIWQGETKKVSVATLAGYVQDTASYSTTETLTGGKWIDGKPIYRSVFTGSFSPNQSLISNVDTFINTYGNWFSGTSECVAFPYGSQYVYRTVILNSLTHELLIYSSGSTTNATIIVEYTKTTD